MSNIVLIEITDAVATITLNRPDSRNALNNELMQKVAAALRDCDQNPSVAAIVLTGAGTSFCAGMDLKELEPGGSMDIGALTLAGDPWPVLKKPLIGAINGPAITGGLELALKCDILFAANTAVFGDTHASVGILPFWGMTIALPQAIGYRNALAMSLSGAFLSAQDAKHLGLVWKVTNEGELLKETHDFASHLATGDQDTKLALLKSYRACAATTFDVARELEHQNALSWQGKGKEFSGRRKAIMARGKQQAQEKKA